MFQDALLNSIFMKITITDDRDALADPPSDKMSTTYNQCMCALFERFITINLYIIIILFSVYREICQLPFDNWTVWKGKDKHKKGLASFWDFILINI
jgi:hypothetical protein